MHLTSLPSRYGIGDLGKEAYNFIDFLKKRIKNCGKYYRLIRLHLEGLLIIVFLLSQEMPC